MKKTIPASLSFWLTVLFVVLKATGAWHITWLVAFLPLIIGTGVGLFFAGFALFTFVVAAIVMAWRG